MKKKQKREILKYIIQQDNLDWAKSDKDFWDFVSKNFTLYEEFVREYRDFLNWEEMCKNRIIANSDVLREFRNELDWDFLGYTSNEKLTKEQKKEFRKELGALADL